MKHVKNNPKNATSNSLNSLWRRKKGVIDVQFNWIFVMIAGFIIFLFIISIVFSQKRNADAQASIGTINQISTLLKSRQQTANVYSEITLPRTDLSFMCDPEADYTRGFTFKISNAERTQLPTEIIFAPPSITTNKIMVWSQAFDLGFPVSVFSYITTADAAILIFNDSDNTNEYAKELYIDLDTASNITHKYIASTTEYSSFARRTIVCFNDKCPSPNNNDYINISPGSSGIFEYGNVTFHKKGQQASADKSLPYITKAGLYGAIFSASSNFYSCQMSRALKQFEIKRALVESRLKLMQDDLPEGTCKLTLEVTVDSEIHPMNNPGFNWNNVTLLYGKSLDLDRDNTDLTMNSCPKIY